MVLITFESVGGFDGSQLQFNAATLDDFCLKLIALLIFQKSMNKSDKYRTDAGVVTKGDGDV